MVPQTAQTTKKPLPYLLDDMSLWFANPKQNKITFMREDMGTDAYLYLPGPSLSQVDFDVRVEGTTAFAVNTAYPRIKPHYWIGMDKPGCYDSRLLYESFPKIIRGTYFKHSYRDRLLRDYPFTYFADIQKPVKGIEDIFTVKKDDLFFAWFNHTLGVALNFIVWMGAKKIHFVGCNLGGTKDYHDDRVLTDVQRKHNRLLYNQQKTFLKEFTALGKKYGVMCISCTDDSPINEFMPYIPLHMAIEMSRSVVGDIVPVKHALDAEQDGNRELAKKITWTQPIRDRGVMIMCDKDQEWLLPWWFENYHRYNHIPVQIVDIGMSDEGIKFCKARGSYTRMPELDLKNWWKKPFALKLTQFKRTLYMDLDCEVRGSVFDMFENYHGFAMTKDVFNKYSTTKNTYNSGVILYDWNDSIIDRWIEQVFTLCLKVHGDQDCLDQVEKTVTELPSSCHALRLNGPNEKAVIYHWTGPTGKDFIKKMINSPTSIDNPTSKVVNLDNKLPRLESA